MSAADGQVVYVRVGGNANAPAGGNARVGTAFADQVAQRRPPEEALVERAFFAEKRLGGSGQCTLRTAIEGLVATVSNAA